MNRVTIVFAPMLLAIGTGAPLMGQTNGREVYDGGKFPTGWSARPERLDGNPTLTSIKFVSSGEDYHLLLGNQTSTLLYRQTDQVNGPFRFLAKFTKAEVPFEYPEGYGLFYGGKELDSANPRYVYFLVRSNGQYLLKRRNGDEVTAVKPWTEHAAIKQTDANGQSTNLLAIEAKWNSPKVVFMVNGQAVDSMDVAADDMNGIVGSRGNWDLDLYISGYVVQRK